MTSATIYFKKLTTEQRVFWLSYCLKSHVSQFCIKCFAAERHIQDSDATDQWRDQPNAAALCPTQRQWFFLANWLSWIINIDRASVEEHPEQHNWLDLSLGCLRVTCQARSTLITQPFSGIAGLSASSDISRGSVATHLRCGGICSDSFITNCLLIPVSYTHLTLPTILRV